MNDESLLETNQHPTIAADPIDDNVDAVYDAFLPHLMSARRSYVRRRLGVIAAGGTSAAASGHEKILEAVRSKG